MSSHKLAWDAAKMDYHVRQDPGAGETLHSDCSLVTYALESAGSGAETRTLSTPQRAGIRITLSYGTAGAGGDSIEINTEDASTFLYLEDHKYDNTDGFFLSNQGEVLDLVSFREGTSYHWQAIGGRNENTRRTYVQESTYTLTPDTTKTGTSGTAVCTLNTGSILHNVLAKVVQTATGATTALDVGLGGNIDNYIDSADISMTSSGSSAAMINAGTNNDQTHAELITSSTVMYLSWQDVGGSPSQSAKVRVAVMRTPPEVS